MKKALNRITAWLLVLVLAFSLLPVTALADGGNPTTFSIRVYTLSSNGRVEKVSGPYALETVCKTNGPHSSGNCWFTWGDIHPSNVGISIPAGYHFEGWTKQQSNGHSFSVGQYVTSDNYYSAFDAGDETLTAARFANSLYLFLKADPTYSVTYKDGVNGEVFADQKTTGLAKGSATPAFDNGSGGTEPSRDGHTFKGWSPALETTVTGNATYTAIWEEVTPPAPETFSVTYKDGVNGEVFADQTTSDLASGTATPAFDNGSGGTEPSRDGYTFKGWSPALASTVTGNATYTAIWEEVTPPAPETFSVTYKDGVNGEVFADQTTSGLAKDSATPAFDNGKGGREPSREGYTFKGWSPALSKSVTADAVYTAVWEEEQEGPAKHVTVQIIPVTRKTDQSGYIAIGTALTKDLDCTLSSHSTTAPISHLVLHRDIHPDNIGLQLNSAYADYTFTGWDSYGTGNFGLNSTGEPRFEASSLNKTGDSSFAVYNQDTIYLVYSAPVIPSVTYTLTYDANGGTGAPAAMSQTNTSGGATFTVSSTEPTNGSLPFLGWATSATATSIDYRASDPIRITTNTTLYAVWGNPPVVLPDAPTPEELKDLVSVTVSCVNTSAEHATKSYELIADSYTVSEPTRTDSTVSATVTVKAAPYVNAYNRDIGKIHTLSSNATYQFTVYYIDGSWSLNSRISNTQVINFNVTCVAQNGAYDNIPKTGDENMMLLGFALTATVAAMLFILVYDRKKKYQP